MTSQQAESVAQELGDILPNDEKLQAEIHRLNRKSFIPLKQVKMLHDWLDGKRQSRQSAIRTLKKGLSKIDLETLKEVTAEFDTLRAKAAEILGSTSPLNLNPLRYLSQRWFSPQALTFPLPGGSCIIAYCIIANFT
ncbi:hypothetical protein [Dolichospermum flos-aquae]|uniref:hypothetical protein n=1 Tax=Dolichospermum flosaquae TaxID=1166 RepID=UPI001B3944B7|nr:hypothetical protein [Dolichospermum flos-aquae]